MSSGATCNGVELKPVTHWMRGVCVVAVESTDFHFGAQLTD